MLIAFGLLVLATITSIYGPRKWLIVSAILAVFGGVALGFSRPGSTQWNQPAAALFFGFFATLFIVSVGWKVRRDRGLG
ncbi:MAG: hypothetical protein IT317_16335 [Anaerolineales bacterium]|nr:hypothetical protein [Anaerolineales bacterium]